MQVGVLSNSEFILLMVGLINLVLGGVVFMRNHKDKSNIMFLCITLGVFWWSISLAISNMFLASPAISLYASISSYLSAIITMYITLYFVVYIGDNKVPISRIANTVVTTITLVTVIITIIPGLVVSQVINVDGVRRLELGPLYNIYTFSMSLMILYIFYKMNKIYKIAKYKVRQQLKFIFTGMLISISVSIITNLLFPIFDLSGFFVAGPASTAIMVSLSGYAIVKYGLWDIKSIMVEVAISMIVLMSLLNIFIDTKYVSSGQLLIFKLSLIPVTVTIAVILVKTFKKEQVTKIRLKKLNKRLKELDERKNEFLHIATHQLRGPITAINGYASLINEGDYGSVSKKLYEPIENILSASKVMSETINDYMNIARIEEDNVVQNQTDFDLCKLVDERAEVRRVNAQDKGIKFSVINEIPDGECIVHADKNNITQVLNALLENAIKYTHKGAVEVVTRLTKGKKRVEVSIKDTGIGVAKDEVAKLFDKFTRADNAKETDAFGTGMGLFIAKNLIEANGGSIKVESEGLSKGTTFTIELPTV